MSADLRFSVHEPATSKSGRSIAILDAEEVRGSNPLAPTKSAGQQAFSSLADLFLTAEERLSQHRRCKAAGQTLFLRVAC
jgi:hypothetical protein